MQGRGKRSRINLARDMSIIGSGQQWTAMLLFTVILLVLPLIFTAASIRNWITFSNFSMITIIAVLGLNIVTGMAGQINMGHSAFILTGSYITAIMTTEFGWPFWGALALSIILTAVIGLIIAAPAIRLKGFYVAVATLAFFFILQYIIKNIEITGGGQGIIGIPGPHIGGLRISSDINWYYLLLPITIIAILGSANLARSRFGRSFLTVRDNEIAAASLGINVPLTKLRAFFLGAMFAGLAGGLWASYVSVVRADTFTFWDSIWYLGMLFIGGAGSTAGVVMGAIALRLISQVLHIAGTSHLLPVSSNMMIYLTYALYGLVIIVFVSFQPHGLIAIWRKFKTNYKRWPFGV